MTEKRTKPAVDTVQSEERQRRYEAEKERLRNQVKPRVAAIRESRRLTDRDLQILINTRA
jgi:hypothetical protein